MSKTAIPTFRFVNAFSSLLFHLRLSSCQNPCAFFIFGHHAPFFLDVLCPLADNLPVSQTDFHCNTHLFYGDIFPIFCKKSPPVFYPFHLFVLSESVWAWWQHTVADRQPDILLLSSENTDLPLHTFPLNSAPYLRFFLKLLP